MAHPHTLAAVILAAGKGTRMHSPEPKVLQSLLGKSILAYVVRAIEPLVHQERLHIVVGHKAASVERQFPSLHDRFVQQPEQLGTGHAVQCVWPRIESSGADYVLVLNGDSPLIRTETIRTFVEKTMKMSTDISFLSISLDNPGAYGRVVRYDTGAIAIVEAKDYDSETHGSPTGEINAGVYCLRRSTCAKLLDRLSNDNASGEYYLTDLIHLAVQQGLTADAINLGDDPSLLGVNTPRELVDAEDRLASSLCNMWLDRGVIIRAAGSVRIGPDVVLEPGADISGPCDILGRSHIAAGATVEPNVWMRDTSVAAGAAVRSFSHLEGCVVGPGSIVGPYARLRPGATLESDCRVGNFVEVKKTLLHSGVKASHLSYLGDAEIGSGTNIGAGTITCNYDGKNKHRTDIGENVFIGSNTALVAPVTVHSGALVGAGSVITRDVPKNTLAVARARQKIIERKGTS